MERSGRCIFFKIRIFSLCLSYFLSTSRHCIGFSDISYYASWLYLYKTCFRFIKFMYSLAKIVTLSEVVKRFWDSFVVLEMCVQRNTQKWKNNPIFAGSYLMIGIIFFHNLFKLSTEKVFGFPERQVIYLSKLEFPSGKWKSEGIFWKIIDKFLILP